MSLLAGKKILLGVSGSIAACKAVDWLRALRREGCEVTVVMTAAACRFVSPLTMAALSGRKVHQDMFAQAEAETIPHISLGRESDLNLVAPASAQTMARLAHGLADDLLAAALLASPAPTLICPAMNSRMYLHPATQANIATLRQHGYQVLEPACGAMACGEEGPGRLAEWETAQQAILGLLSPRDLAGVHILVTAGPTREELDPARYLSNRSSGKMGYALAQAARQRGAQVTLVSGPTSLPRPDGLEFVPVTTALEMHREVMARCQEAGVIIKAAAVADYRPAEPSQHKVKKDQSSLHLTLLRNPDILRELGERKKSSPSFPLLVGFAAESREHVPMGREKLRTKNLDLIAINDIAGADTGFAVETNRVTLLDAEGGREDLPLLSKEETAQRILDRVAKLLAERGGA
jgi:phosphopantothenoylcysteine decarboxylase / phosphopantothenate---cysteine ligase